ncbi:hypothetical protein GPJ56_007202 [Histomonas meleagridis]|uniref:uncharacterized protein n=1 Tax=Histomonas meleagridis TaxID=135588 RepID=UPI00355AA045|nr:hypothetical protein GPJ56_007202 [Histomonas meleagridis]KAH0800125.1 hypothetical protein GO595_007237 [Histomonas meleagridis]
MDLLLSEVIQPTGANDACIIQSFMPTLDVLAIAQGDRIIIYPMEDGFIGEPNSFQVYGEIEKIVPIQMSYGESGMMLILNDLRTCILQNDPDSDSIKIKTLATGNLTPTSNFPRTPIKIATHPTAIVIKYTNFTIEVFPISSHCTLDPPLPITIGCKRIIDFAFVGPTSKVTRLAILSEEFNTPPILRVIDIDLMNSSFTSDPSMDVTLPNDTYKIIPYDPENSSLIIAFSSQQAIRIMYDGLTPTTTTATIFTPYQIIDMFPMSHNFYVSIDSHLTMRYAKIEEQGPVHFVDFGISVPQPISSVSISSSLAFIASNDSDSVLYNIDQESLPCTVRELETFKSTGGTFSFNS